MINCGCYCIYLRDVTDDQDKSANIYDFEQGRVDLPHMFS